MNEKKPKIYAITNQKGGVGKTTTAINLAAGLGIMGKKVLLIDLDPQANTTIGIGVEKESVKNDLFEALVNDVDAEECLIKTNSKNVDLIPSSINLAGAEIYLSISDQNLNNIFKRKFVHLENRYDFIIMDCPPSLGLINRNALAYADEVIIPVQTEYYALEGLTQLLSTISLTKKMFNTKLKIGGILLTMYDSRTNLSSEVKDEVNKFFREKVFKAKIPRNIKLAEAPSTGQSIFEYGPSSTGAIEYMNLVKEILSN